MTYPKTKLTRSLRLTIMLVLIASFFVISPLLIMYTAGYRYDFINRQIKQTGVISIDVKPADAIVHLNNVRINKSLPVRLANRAPGIYNIKISKNGFHEWKKEINVESSQTFYVKNITLLKQALPITAEQSTENIFPVVLFPSTTSSVWFDHEGKAWEQQGEVFRNNDEIITLPKSTDSLIAVSKNFILAGIQDKIYLLNRNNEHRQQILSVNQTFFNAFTNEWLLWSPNELWTVYQDGRAVLLLRTSEEIKQVLPLDENGLLLITNKNKLMAFNPGYYLSQDLLNNVEIQKVKVEVKKRLIYFSGKIGQKEGLFELEY